MRDEIMCKTALLLGGALAVGILISGCATQKAVTPAESHPAVGTVAAQLRDGTDRRVALAPNVVQGTVIGGSIGWRMDALDRHVAGLALSDSAPQQATRWYNTETGIHYVLVPTDSFAGPDGPCRNFNMVANASGHPQFADGLACRQPDGRWVETR
jgi:surface antigen